MSQRRPTGIAFHATPHSPVDPELAHRANSGAGIETATKDPNFWLNISQIICYAVGFLAIVAILILFLVWVVPTHTLAKDLKSEVDSMKEKATPGACWSGCSDKVETCSVSGDCTPLLVPEGTNTDVDCVFGVCVYYTTPPAFPAAGLALAEDACVGFLDAADERLPCLHMTPVESSDVFVACQFINGCSMYVPPPIIPRNAPKTISESEDAPAKAGDAENVAPANAAARSAAPSRRVLRK